MSKEGGESSQLRKDMALHVVSDVLWNSAQSTMKNRQDHFSLQCVY